MEIGKKPQTLLDLFKIKKRQGGYRKSVKRLAKKIISAKVRAPRGVESVSQMQNVQKFCLSDHEYSLNVESVIENQNSESDDYLTHNWLQFQSEDSEIPLDNGIILDASDIKDSIDWSETSRKFRKRLSEWSIQNQVTKYQLKDLLRLCNETLPFKLPIDPRTIMSTPSSIVIHTFDDNSQYWHHGIKKALYMQLQSASNLPQFLSFNINIDGLPLYESSQEQFWPILFNINELHHIEPMIVGIFCGKSM